MSDVELSRLEMLSDLNEKQLTTAAADTSVAVGRAAAISAMRVSSRSADCLDPSEPFASVIWKIKFSLTL